MRKRKTYSVTQLWSGWVLRIGNQAKLLLFAAGLLITQASYSQNREKERIKQLEQQAGLNEAAMRQQQQSRILIDSAIQLVQNGAYIKAEQVFLEALKSVKSVPSELTYFFGENSFHLGKYRQSIDWLTKYIQLKGTTGIFSTQAAGFLKRAEDALVAELNQQKEQASEILSKDYDIDCGPLGKVVCPVCNGRTVIVKKSYLSDTFTTCQFCDEHGFLSCDDYNKLLRGQLKGKSE